MGRYGAENGPAKAARHFPQLLDSKLHDTHAMWLHRFWSRNQITRFKTHQIAIITPLKEGRVRRLQRYSASAEYMCKDGVTRNMDEGFHPSAFPNVSLVSIIIHDSPSGSKRLFFFIMVERMLHSFHYCKATSSEY